MKLIQKFVKSEKDGKHENVTFYVPRRCILIANIVGSVFGYVFEISTSFSS